MNVLYNRVSYQHLFDILMSYVYQCC